MHTELQALLQGQGDKNLLLPLQEDATQTHSVLPGPGQGARGQGQGDQPLPVRNWVSSPVALKLPAPHPHPPRLVNQVLLPTGALSQ